VEAMKPRNDADASQNIHLEICLDLLDNLASSFHSPSINIETDEHGDDNGDSTSTWERVAQGQPCNSDGSSCVKTMELFVIVLVIETTCSKNSSQMRNTNPAPRTLSGFHSTSFHCTMAFSTPSVYTEVRIFLLLLKRSICSNYQKPPEEPIVKRPPCHSLKSQSIV